jgi:prophage maintenance system killer protein
MPTIKLEPSRSEFSELAIQLVKDFNKDLVKQRGKKYCVDERKLDDILTKDIRYRADRIMPVQAIMRRAANIITYGIRKRPFCAENNRTMVSLALAYLEANGIVLTESKKVKIRTLIGRNKNARNLDDIIEKFLTAQSSSKSG